MSVDHNTTVILGDIEHALFAADKEARQKPACLLILTGELSGSIFDLAPGDNVVGRHPECAICVDLPGFSRRHFKVTLSEQGATLTDLGSANGTYLNNAKLAAPAALKRADMIKVGAVALKYLPARDPERLTYDKLRREGTTDGLTQCYNKAFFNSALEVEVRKAKASGESLTLAIFDLDHFKKLNDGHGHDAGDYVLKEMARLVRETGIRQGDLFARYGGEEFCLLLPKTPLAQGAEIAERLRQRISQHAFIYDEKLLEVSASIGVADVREGVDTATDLFKRADAGVYRSKEGGRNRVSVVDDAP